MDKIQVKILNPEVILDAERMSVAMARLTQRGETINNIADFEALMEKPYGNEFIRNLTALPHPTLQKFSVINVVVIGASRRFLAQITRHQNEVKFMSGSLQYSDYSDTARFCVPYEVIKHDAETGDSLRESYLSNCMASLDVYSAYAQKVGRDAAGYIMPQGMRNILVISATPYQWKHMISQRTCRRNTLETRYVMLLIWQELKRLSSLFEAAGPDCTQRGGCREGKMACGNPVKIATPQAMLEEDFNLIL